MRLGRFDGRALILGDSEGERDVLGESLGMKEMEGCVVGEGSKEESGKVKEQEC